MVSSHLGPPVSAVRGALAEWSHNAGKSRLHPACYERTLTMVSSHGPPVSAVRGALLKEWSHNAQESPVCTPRATRGPLPWCHLMALQSRLSGGSS